MARNDVRLLTAGGHSSELPARVYQTEAGSTDIVAGEPTKLNAAGSPYVIPVATAEPVVGTTTAVTGIAANDSTHTATEDGVVSVFQPVPGATYVAKANNATNIDTQAKLDALANDRVVFDLTSSTYTIDEDAGDGATNGLYIVGGSVDKGEIFFTIRVDATNLGQ